MTDKQKKIYDILNEYSNKRITLTEIAEKLGMGSQDLNSYLQTMERNGLVTRRLPKVSDVVKIKTCKVV